MYTSRDHIHLHRFKKGKEEKRIQIKKNTAAKAKAKEAHEYNAQKAIQATKLFVLHAIYSYYTISENRIHIFGMDMLYP